MKLLKLVLKLAAKILGIWALLVLFLGGLLALEEW